MWNRKKRKGTFLKKRLLSNLIENMSIVLQYWAEYCIIIVHVQPKDHRLPVVNLKDLCQNSQETRMDLSLLFSWEKPQSSLCYSTGSSPNSTKTPLHCGCGTKTAGVLFTCWNNVRLFHNKILTISNIEWIHTLFSWNNNNVYLNAPFTFLPCHNKIFSSTLTHHSKMVISFFKKFCFEVVK